MINIKYTFEQLFGLKRNHYLAHNSQDSNTDTLVPSPTPPKNNTQYYKQIKGQKIQMTMIVKVSLVRLQKE